MDIKTMLLIINLSGATFSCHKRRQDDFSAFTVKLRTSSFYLACF